MIFSTATLNTWKCDGSYSKRLPLMVKELNKYAPLVLCCQEVFSCPDLDVDTSDYLSKKLDVNSFFYPSRAKFRKIIDKEGYSYSGLATFTNLKVSEHKKVELPSNLKDDGDRTAQLISLDYNEYRFCIINTHLTHLSFEKKLRLFQIQSILVGIDHDAFDVIILHGDLNDTPDSLTVKTIQENFGFSSFFEDFPHTMKQKCLDYIFYKSKKKITTLDAKVICNTPDVDGVYPSDHFGLFVKFKIEDE